MMLAQEKPEESNNELYLRSLKELQLSAQCPEIESGEMCADKASVKSTEKRIGRGLKVLQKSG